MNKLILFFFLLLTTVSHTYGQTDNYSVKFDGTTGNIDFRNIPELGSLETYTIQFWMNPSVWAEGASVFSRGSGNAAFAVKLGVSGELNCQVGAKTITISSAELKAEKWTQVSIIVNQKTMTPYIDGIAMAAQVLAENLTIPQDESSFLMGDKFNGRIDEFRLWNCAVTEEYLLYNNTLNKFHPDYKNLIVYYKFDQNECENIVDYTFKHHGIVSNVVREKVTDNNVFKYRILTAYSAFSRFCDREIDKDKYLLCNDLVILGVGSSSNGSASISLPYDLGVLAKARYMENWNDRKGVLALDGNGAKMEVGKNALTGTSGYSFYTWMFIDEWIEGAFLFKKEKDENTGISLRLGKEDVGSMILRVNGNEYVYKNTKTPITVNKWIHFGFSTYDNRIDNYGRDLTYMFTHDKLTSGLYATEFPSTLQNPALHDLGEVTAVVGENFKGKLDETVIWNGGQGRDAMIAHMNPLSLPGFDKKVDVSFAHNVSSYWKYDKPENPGHDSFSYKEYVDIMRSAYAGHRGFKIRMSVSGHNGWEFTFADAEKRESLGRDIAAIAEDFDGIDLDFEWTYSTEGWKNYALVVEQIRKNLSPGKLLTVTPHAVAYGYPKEYMKDVDYFLFQVYGPSKWQFTRDNYTTAYNNFVKTFPKDKIVMSFATTTSAKHTPGGDQIAGQPPIAFRQITYTDPASDESNGYFFTGYDQTQWRADFVNKNDLAGIMYWDLGGDVPKTSAEFSLVKACNYVLSSNVDTLVTKVNMDPTNIPATTATKLITLFPNPAKDCVYISFPNDKVLTELQLFDVNGRMLNEKKINATVTPYRYDLNNLSAGVYYLKLKTSSGEEYSQSLLIN